MLFSKSISVTVSIALAAIASSFVEASPLRIPEGPVARSVESIVAADASSDGATAYVPVSERVYTAEQLAEHEVWLQKRSSAGYNDWSCIPTAAHPRPIVLVHGLIANKDDNWFYMAPRLKSVGYCVYSFTYGSLPGIPLIAGLDKMETSAAQLSAFVDKVLDSTKVAKVDLVGHSQGSLMPRYYLKFLGGAAKVSKFAGFGTIAHGTTLNGIYPFLASLGLYDPIKRQANTLIPLT
ncbi:hypothetical protein BGX29_008488 [Mortierella sp. GBA35]|nr:hypothetical protein BGX23_008477 [Mortierella sp. AD031]KAF9106770.1 hypothetical protein BGX29_008488 [Mortierella sp. GBA35]